MVPSGIDITTQRVLSKRKKLLDPFQMLKFPYVSSAGVLRALSNQTKTENLLVELDVHVNLDLGILLQSNYIYVVVVALLAERKNRFASRLV